MFQLLTLNELIDAAIAAEDAARKVYLGFTHKFAHHPEAAQFWQTMADDEAGHAQLLADIRCRIPAAELLMPVDARLAEQAEQLKSLDIHKLVNTVRNLDDAYQTAYRLESSEVNTIFNFLTIRFLSTEESYTIISTTIDRHLLRLAEFIHAFGSADRCKQIPAIA